MDIITHPKVAKFVDKLSNEARVEVGRYVELLRLNTYHLEMPWSKKIANSLYELRILSPSSIRIVYTFYQGKIFLIHGFFKKSQRISLKDFRLAKNRLKKLTLYN